MPKKAITADSPARVYLRGLGCFRAQLPADGEAPPERLKVCPWGVTETRQGKVVLDEEAARLLTSNMTARRMDSVPLDFEHTTAGQQATLANQPVKRAGFGTLEVVPGEGLFLSAIRWTRDGREHFDSYNDLSPAIRRNKDGRITLLDSVALCAHGEIEGLTLFFANETTTQEISAHSVMKDLVKQFLHKDGITVPADADDEQLTTLAAQHLESEAAKSKAAKAGDQKEEEDSKLEKLSAQMAALEKRHADEAAARDAKEKDRLVKLAAAEGKEVPFSADELKTFSVEALEKIIAKLPAGEVPIAGKNTDGGEGKTVALSATQKEINSICGVSEDEFTKFNA